MVEKTMKRKILAGQPCQILNYLVHCKTGLREKVFSVHLI